MSESQHSAALTWIERNHPGGVALVARALSESGKVECEQCGRSLAWHEDNRPRHTFCPVPVAAPAKPPAPSVPSVRVRIAVATAALHTGGRRRVMWSSCGDGLDGSDAADGFLRQQALGGLVRNLGVASAEQRVSFVEADVPLPEEPKTVAGEVVS